MVRGDLPAADAELHLMTGLGQELRQPSQVWASMVAEATRNLFVGRMEDAEEYGASPSSGHMRKGSTRPITT